MDRQFKCWGCGAEAPAGDSCPECGRLQPFPPGLDHWAVLGLRRRLLLEQEELERRVHALNRRFHPDYFRLRSPEEQAISLEAAAAVNTAYRVLRHPVARIEYLLEREGLAPGTQGSGPPPADLLEEVMELQEARQELAGAAPTEAAGLRARLEAAREALTGRVAATEAEMLALAARWDATEDEGLRRRLLERLREVLARRAYLRTALRDLSAALGEPGGDGVAG